LKRIYKIAALLLVLGFVATLIVAIHPAFAVAFHPALVAAVHPFAVPLAAAVGPLGIPIWY
jgi:hypothetical protein